MKRENPQIRFLIADTVSMYASCLESFLLENTRAGRIEVANSKLELLDLMEDLHHDLLIIEPWCSHGTFSGTDIEFLRAFRARYPNLPIVIFTHEIAPDVLHKIARLERIAVTSKRDVLDICERVLSGDYGVMSRTIERIVRRID